MTSGLVVDASVAASWLLLEDFSAAALRLLQPGLPLVAPELIVGEVGNALWKAARRGEASDAQLAAAADVIGDALAQLHPLLPLLPVAAACARRLDHPIYDCFYLALAQREGLPLATADRRLARLAEGEGIEVRLVAPDVR